MPQWNYKLQLSDVFHNEALSFPEKRDAIVTRIQKASWYDENDFQLDDAVGGLAEAEDTDEFDGYWADFYDWADDNRIWVNTF